MTRFPYAPYPNGWFPIAQSEELKPEAVLPVRHFGQELVLYRGKSGAPHLLEAYCPHMGAHLGHGGCVQEDDIVCPFHAWRFSGAGTCQGIPYAQKVPRQARLKSFPVREGHGLIMAYHHATGQAPTSEPIIPEENDGTWTAGRWKQYKLRTHVQEVAENSVDTAHFRFIHGANPEPTLEATQDGAVLRSVVTMDRDIPGVTLPGQPLHSRTEISVVGLGMTVSFTQLGQTQNRVLVCMAPIDEEFVKLMCRVQVGRMPTDEMTAGLEEAVFQEVIVNLERDIHIWEHKICRSQPVLCDGDGPIGLFRRWARQFYESPAEAGVRAEERVA